MDLLPLATEHEICVQWKGPWIEPKENFKCLKVTTPAEKGSIQGFNVSDIVGPVSLASYEPAAQKRSLNQVEYFVPGLFALASLVPASIGLKKFLSRQRLMPECQ